MPAQKSAQKSAQNRAHAAPLGPAELLLLLPCSLRRAVRDAELRGWLARCDALIEAAPADPLGRVLGMLGMIAPAGQAALRWFGETGERPAGWLAAADPVWLQAGLDHLFLHAPLPGDFDADAFAEALQDINRELLSESDLRLLPTSGGAYLAAEDGFETAAVPAAVLSGGRPDEALPSGERYSALSSEIQMFLHEHPFNVGRMAAGQPPLNALWFWGGGQMPDVAQQTLPHLCSDDPLLRGFWQASGNAATATAVDWDRPDTLGGSIVVPGNTADIDALLDRSRRAFERRAVRSLRIGFACGHTLSFRRRLFRRFARPLRAIMDLEAG